MLSAMDVLLDGVKKPSIQIRKSTGDNYCAAVHQCGRGGERRRISRRAAARTEWPSRHREGISDCVLLSPAVWRPPASRVRVEKRERARRAGRLGGPENRDGRHKTRSEQESTGEGQRAN